MIEAFLSRISRATTVNTLNLAIIDALNLMTPIEVAETTHYIHKKEWRFPGEVPEERVPEFTSFSRGAVGKTLRSMHKASKPRPERFTRKVLLPGILHFEGRGQRRERTLIVGFPGNGGRLMMPLPIILQYLSAEKVDLVLVPDGHKANYRKGIVPLADTVGEALVHLGEHLPRGYRRVVTLGTSSGGVPSLLAAPVVGARTVLAVGAGHPDDERWIETCGVSKRELIERVAPALARCKVALAFGAQSLDDEGSADALIGMLPHARKVPVSIANVEVKHAALNPMAETGELGAFLAGHLGLA